jgi:hypothetical protein
MTKDSIRHMVIFCLKHDKQALETEKFLMDGQTILCSIPGVEKFEVLKQISPKNEYDYGFSMEFSDKTAYENYNNHPLHVGFVNQRWLKEVTKFLEIDFKS